LTLLPAVLLERQHAGALAAAELERLERVEKTLRSRIRAALDEEPDAVFIDARTPMRFLERLDPEGTMNLLDWLNEDAAFRQTLEQCYTATAPVKLPRELLVYQRTCDVVGARNNARR
jgi:hypothetical protein